MDRSKVKIVKKADAGTLKTKKRKSISSRAAARGIVSNVTGWVADLKERKTNETKAAFDLLFAANQRPSES
ncbi:MAG TPA: hypothetical protein PLP21_15420 [Pyrinomonadaceae bacterium]|nr:hypothetical protein [Acidobacteriota bacterium]HQZ97711.1 hypothetical protein [Pyrinomonadaceae bacterium]